MFFSKVFQCAQSHRHSANETSDVDVDVFFIDQKWLTEPHLEGEFGDWDGHSPNERYVPIASDRVEELKVQAPSKHLRDGLGVVFLKDGKPIHPSSGQRLFSYIVINILGTIRRNSLVLVDEPELFLHPTLEIAFIRMPRAILASYGSKTFIRIADGDAHCLAAELALDDECLGAGTGHTQAETRHLHVLEESLRLVRRAGKVINSPRGEPHPFGGLQTFDCVDVRLLGGWQLRNV